MNPPSPTWAEISGSLSDKNAAKLYAAASGAAQRIYSWRNAETLDAFRVVVAPHNHEIKRAICEAATDMGLDEADRDSAADALLWKVQGDQYDEDPAKWGPSWFYEMNEERGKIEQVKHWNIALYLVHRYNVVSHAGGQLFFRYQDGVYVMMDRKPANTYADADPYLIGMLSIADMNRINEAMATLGGQLSLEEIRDQLIKYTARGVKKLGPLRAMPGQDGQDLPCYKINCLNKLLFVDANGVKAVDHARERVMLHMVKTEYVPGAVCPIFIRYVESALDGDVWVILTLKEAMAATFLPGVFNHRCIVILNGTQDGGNGKGITMDMLGGIIGEDYTCNMSPDGFDLRWGPKRAYDKVANINTELKLASIKNPVNYLTITGGGAIPVEFKNVNKEVMTTMPIWHWHSYNTAPEVTPTAYAIFRRVAAFVDFMVEFEDQPRDMAIERLPHNPEERRGVFAMLVDLMPGLIRAGQFTHQQTVAEIKERFLGASNTGIDFINHVLESTNNGSRILFADMYARYYEWVRANHPERPPLSERRFARALLDSGFSRGQARGGKRFYSGVKYRKGPSSPGEPQATLDNQ